MSTMVEELNRVREEGAKELVRVRKDHEKELVEVKREAANKINQVKKEGAERERKFEKEIGDLKKVINNMKAEIAEYDKALEIALNDVKEGNETILQQRNRIERLECLNGRPAELEAKIEKLQAEKNHHKRKEDGLRYGRYQMRTEHREKIREYKTELSNKVEMLDNSRMENASLRRQCWNFQGELRRERNDKLELKNKYMEDMGIADSTQKMLINDRNTLKRENDLLKDQGVNQYGFSGNQYGKPRH